MRPFLQLTCLASLVSVSLVACGGETSGPESDLCASAAQHLGECVGDSSVSVQTCDSATAERVLAMSCDELSSSSAGKGDEWKSICDAFVCGGANGPPPPPMIVDNTGADFHFGHDTQNQNRETSGWTAAANRSPLQSESGFYGDDFYSTYTGQIRALPDGTPDYSTSPPDAWWTTTLPRTGRYTVYVKYPAFPDNVTHADYWSGVAVRHVDQTQPGTEVVDGIGGWFKLGTWSFPKGVAMASLHAQAGYPDPVGKRVVADAVAWVFVE